MDVGNILRPESVHCELGARSKKHALELLSEALAETSEAYSAEEILDGLIHRERLGCTGLGRSVAMPHTRVSGLKESVGAFLRLAERVSEDSGSAPSFVFDWGCAPSWTSKMRYCLSLASR